MREIKFRGKRIGNGEWVFGYLFISWERYYVLWGTTNGVPTMNEVIPATVGQFTGLKDCNGKDVYEGDVLNHYAVYGHVVFEDGMFSLSTSAKVHFGEHRQPLCYIDVSKAEVIGNIHEDSHLLGKAGKP